MAKRTIITICFYADWFTLYLYGQWLLLVYSYAVFVHAESYWFLTVFGVGVHYSKPTHTRTQRAALYMCTTVLFILLTLSSNQNIIDYMVF